MAIPRIIQSGIRDDVIFGKNVSIVSPVNLYGCQFGDDCFIGPFVEIQSSVIIGNNCRIQSHSFICEYVTIGNFVFIAHGVKFVNDLMKNGSPAYGTPELWGKTKLGNNISIGTNATILPVSICDNCVIGAGSVVTKDIQAPGIYAGNPAKFIRSL